MNIQELQTVVTEGLPIKIFVINNQALGKIAEIQRGTYHERYLITTCNSGYTVPDFEKIATAYGMRSKTLHSYEELDRYRDWLSDSYSCLFNIVLPEATWLLPKMNWNEKEMNPAIDHRIRQEVIALLSS